MIENKEAAAVDTEAVLEADYKLTSDDVYTALKNTKKYKKNVIKAIIETAIIAGLTIFFGIWWIIWDDFNAMIFCIAFAVLIALIWAVVSLSIRSNCNKFVSADNVHLTINKDGIIINGREPIPLDGTVACKNQKDILILKSDKNEWTLIPLKNLPQAEAIKERILSGTREWTN